MNKYKTLDEFFADQSEEKRIQIKMLRRIILDAEPGLIETIKWNAPNYSYKGEDRLTFNLVNKQGLVKLVIHMGSVKKESKNTKSVLEEDEGIVEWNSNIRGTLSFDDIADIKKKAQLVQNVIKKWLAISTE